MNDRQLRTFLKVADCGSLSKAQDALSTTRQALKKQLESLEAETHTELLARGPRGYSLTPAGRLFYDGAEQIIELYDRLLEKLDADKGVTLRVGAPDGGLPRLLLRIIARYAEETKSDVKLVSVPAGEETRMLLEGRVDVCAASPDHGNANGVRYVAMGSVTMHCLVAKGSPLASRKSVGLEDLDGQTVGFSGAPFFEELLRALRGRLNPVHVQETKLDTYEIANLCLSGGIMLVNGSIADEFAGIFSVVDLDFDCNVNYGFIRRRTDEVQVDDFLAVAQKVFNERKLR